MLNSRWMYLVGLLPTLATFVETGALPSPDRWLAEVIIGALLVLMVCNTRQHIAQLAKLSTIDPLTGLQNRRYFDQLIGGECERSKRTGYPLSLVFIDLNNFKEVNDEIGHAAGDYVLKQCADAIKEAIRVVDSAFRVGGDEFAILLPVTTPEQAQKVIDRVRAACVKADKIWESNGLGISAGIVQLKPDEDVASFINRADLEMYRQKRLLKLKR